MKGIDEDITSLLSYASSRGGKKLIYQRGMHKQDKAQRSRYKNQSVDYTTNDFMDGRADELKKYLNQKNISRFNEDHTNNRNNKLQTKSQCQQSQRSAAERSRVSHARSVFSRKSQAQVLEMKKKVLEEKANEDIAIEDQD